MGWNIFNTFLRFRSLFSIFPAFWCKFSYKISSPCFRKRVAGWTWITIFLRYVNRTEVTSSKGFWSQQELLWFCFVCYQICWLWYSSWQKVTGLYDSCWVWGLAEVKDWRKECSRNPTARLLAIWQSEGLSFGSSCIIYISVVWAS